MYNTFSEYSIALKNLFTNVFNGDVVIEPPDDAFDYAIKQTEDNLKFPFISIYPNNTIYLDNKNNAMPSYSEGMQFQNPMPIYNDEDRSFIGLNDRLSKNAEFLYILIGYQIDIWGTTRLDTEKLVQELLFWLYQNQQIESQYSGVNLHFNFDIGNEIVDNSDLTQYQSSGKLYRYTCSIQAQVTLIRSENYFTVKHPNVAVEEKK